MGKLTVLPKALLFDLDGTLANTIPQLAIAASKSAVAIGLNPPSVETTKGFVGNGVNMLLSLYLKYPETIRERGDCDGKK